MSDLSWTNVTVKLSDLLPWTGNPKTSTGKNAKQLQDSHDELGQFQTVAIEPTDKPNVYQVADGHQRLSAWLAKYGKAAEIDARLASRPLTETERRKIAIYSRQIGAWDWDTLSGWEPDELTEWGFDVDLLQDWRRDVAALGNFLESEEEQAQGDAEPQTNRAEELRKEWGVELGQMWRLPSRVEGQEHRLICGDCTDTAVVDRVMGGEKADIEIHDPPYGMDLDTDFSGMESKMFKGKTGGASYAPIHGDNEDFNPSHLLASKCKELFLWGADYYCERIASKNDGSWFVWDKRLDESADKMWGSCFETLWSKSPHKRDMIRVKWAGIFGMEGEPDKERIHPTQKPVKVYTWLLEKYSKAGDITADYYLGGASHLIAAENLSRQCRAVEISPAYVAVALQRYLDAFGIRAELVE